MNKNRLNRRQKVFGLIMAILMSFGICTICFILSLILGISIAGPEIYDYESGSSHHANEDAAIIAVTTSHLCFWMGSVFNTKYLTDTNLWIASVVSLPFLVLFFSSWSGVMFLILVG